MSDLLAIDFESHQVCGIEAQHSRGHIRIRKCLVLRWPEDRLPATDAQAAGTWLRSELNRLGVTSRQVVVSIPREAAVVRPLELPPGPDEELPDLVRLQAATRSAVPIDQLLLDYLPLPHGTESGGRDVLMATISRQQAEQIRHVLKAAELELGSIGLSSSATAELIVRAGRSRAERPESTSLVVVRQGDRVEISILRRQHLLFTHSTLLAGDNPQQHRQSILAETSRSVVALAETSPGLKITSIWIVDGDAEDPELAEALRNRLSCDVLHTLDPLSHPEVELRAPEVPGNRGLYAAPVGLLLSQEEKTVESIDFLNPRRRAVKRDLRKLQVGAIAALLVLFFVVHYIFVRVEMNRLVSEIDRKRVETEQLDLSIEPQEPVLASAKTMTAWEERNIRWLEQLERLNASLESTDRVYLTDADFRTLNRGPVATIKANGFAREREDVDALNVRFAELGYRVNPHGISRTDKDPAYPWSFQLDLELDEQPEISTGGETTQTPAEKPQSAGQDQSEVRR